MDSEASKLLEAALQQMDGIIQGAKFDLPSSRSSLSLTDVVKDMRRIICSQPDATTSDIESLDFIYKWLQKNIANSTLGIVNEDMDSILDAQNNGIGVTYSSDDKVLQLESEKESLLLELTVLGEHVAQQNQKLLVLEQALNSKKDILRRTEMQLEREARLRRCCESQKGEQMAEIATLRSKCASIEKQLNISYNENQMMNNSKRFFDDTSLSSLTQSTPTPTDYVNTISPHTNIESHVVDMNFKNDLESNSSVRNPRGLKKMLTKIKRSNSGSQLQTHRHPILQQTFTPEFRRGGTRATLSGRLDCPTIDVSRNRDVHKNSFTPLDSTASSKMYRRKPVVEWSVEIVVAWLRDIGFGIYTNEALKNEIDGFKLTQMTSANDFETKLGIKLPIHRKKVFVHALPQYVNNHSLSTFSVQNWLDDIGLPQFKETFVDASIDSVPMIDYLSMEDLSGLKICNQLHHLSLKRAIEVAREVSFQPSRLVRRPTQNDNNFEDVSLWTNHRVMEWLSQVDLSEFAPNLRGSGVHGAIMVRESRFNDVLLADLLAIPPQKTLLRRHVTLHFNLLVGNARVQEKRACQREPGNVTLTPTRKCKVKNGKSQFSLKRRKSSKTLIVDLEDLLCPLQLNDK